MTYFGDDMLNPQHKLYRWGPIGACPLFMYFTIETAFAPLKKLFGISYTQSLIIFKDKKVTWFLDDKELSKQSKQFVEQVILQPKNSNKYFNLWDLRSEKLTKLFSRLDRIDFTSLTDKLLSAEYKKFTKTYNDWFIITISIELAASYLEPLLGERLRKYFPEQDQTEYQKAFSTLSAPGKFTFYRQEQRDLLRILTLPKQKQEKALQKHQEKYYWILNSYSEGKVLSVDYFKAELKKQAAGNFRKVLNEIESYVPHIIQDKTSLTKKINPSADDLKLINAVGTFSRLLDERKMYNFRAEHYLELFVQEYAKRTRQSNESLKYLLPNELGQSLTYIDHNLIQKRKECLVFNCTDMRIQKYEGPQASKLAEKFLGVSHIKQDIIHGTVASMGVQRHFRGIARIILSIDQIDRVKTGDILVTTMTSPDFVIGMKKAGAIITDTGGMLSHAAIVSRELNIPCIVGTQIATKIIRDGDIVELHCVRGLVKVLRHVN